MESSSIVVFSCVAGGLFLLFSVLALIFWARVAALEDAQDQHFEALQAKAEPRALEQALATAESAAQRVDNAVIQLQKFREGVHSEMQRFYAIMRRNEKTFGKTIDVEKEEGESYPEEIPVSAVGKTVETEEPISKADLRRKAREAGMRI